jgi:hypothetical protein
MRSGMILASIAASCLVVPAVQASDADAILDKLVEKGVLTSAEAQEVRNEIGGQAKQRDDEMRALIKEAGADLVPKWAQSVAWGGDIRLRQETLWQWHTAKTDSTSERKHASDRNRQRIRMRLGMKAKVGPALEAGVRIATSSDLSPISTNQTMSDIFDKKDLFLDQAYIKATTAGLAQPWPVPIAVWGGKFEIPFAFTPLVWDPDVTLEGLAASLTPAAGPVEFALSGGAFPIDELKATEGDPVLLAGQAGVTWSPASKHWRPSLKALKIKAAAAYYDFTNLEAGLKTLKSARFGNAVLVTSEEEVTFLARDFDELDVNCEMSTMILHRPARLFGDYVRNTSAGGDDEGYMAGVRWGRSDAAWSWEAGYFYEHLESDAVVGAFTDSDFGEGGTGGEGHVASIAVGTLKGSTLGARFCVVNAIKGDDRQAKQFQVDWVTKF